MEINRQTLQFISDHASDSPAALRLRFSGKSLPGVDIPLAVTQIEARQKASAKLRGLLDASPEFLFPDTLSAEQCTALPVARLHAQIAGPQADVLDLTCGLGIDTLALASVAQSVTTCDLEQSHTDCLQHNAAVLGKENLRPLCVNAVDYLNQLPAGKRFSLIFADPARRDSAARRTYALEDCSPDILSLIPAIRRHTDRLLLKVSPMLDVAMLLRQLPCVAAVYAVSLKGECKELAVDCRFDMASGSTRFIAVDIKAGGSAVEFSFGAEDEAAAVPVISSVEEVRVGQWLFEPNASLMKFIGHAPLAGRYPSLRKVGANTHLYVSQTPLPSDMPGRVLHIENVMAPGKRMAKSLPERVNIVTRNYPDRPEAVKARFRIKDGGTDFLYCCRLQDRLPRMLLCSPVPAVGE